MHGEMGYCSGERLYQEAALARRRNGACVYECGSALSITTKHILTERILL